jgi:hypothetical protein
MRAFIISTGLVLALTQVGPALSEDANHIQLVRFENKVV